MGEPTPGCISGIGVWRKHCCCCKQHVSCGCSYYGKRLSWRIGDGLESTPGCFACSNIPGRQCTAERPASHGRLFTDGQPGRLNKDNSAGKSSSCSFGCTAGNRQSRCLGHCDGRRVR
jgi:hypothetical protein